MFIHYADVYSLRTAKGCFHRPRLNEMNGYEKDKYERLKNSI